MFPAFDTALSAMTADSTAIDVVGNNLANLNTTGFKASEVNFHDLVAQSLGAGGMNGQVGMGVGQVQAVQNFTQGSINTTNGPMDAAIEGDGFFVVKDANNNTLYTRAGNFQLDASGNLLTATGQYVQGWTAVNGVVNPNGPVGNLVFPVGGLVAPTPTSTMSMTINLNSQADTTGPTSTFAAPIQVYDSQGNAHTLTITFTKTGANAWSYTATLPAADLTKGTSTTVGQGTLTFDGTGTLTTPAATDPPQAIKITNLADGADTGGLTINWSLYDASGNPLITQYAQTSGMSNPVQDGNSAGQVTKIGIQNGGLIVANYSNGRQLTIGQIALASITNPSSLIQVGNNNLQTSAATAQVAVGPANSGSRGQIEGGALEASTADMAGQFTDLLTYERSYQAASRIITTSDTLLQETVNLIHP
ncbi:MAG TPA: flagellar hook protein FlgE [Bryobacteraceae bacterium]|nr:flagellar hook protein FlgE [Bryobacteraceae bacterium]